jgi:signal transduction histidine kinase
MLLDAQQKPAGVEGILRDITDRKLTEQDVRRDLESLTEIQRIASLGHCEIDLTTNSLSWSEETHRIFETASHQFGATYEDFLASVHPDDREWVDSAYVSAIQKGVPIDIVHRLLFGDGRTKYVSTRGKVIADALGKPVRMRCTIQDITVQKRQEIDALEYWRKRDQLQHEQIAVQTAVALAHDLNQPLLAITAYCEASLKMLENVVIDRQRIAGVLSASVQQAMRAGETIRDMLAFLDRRDAPVEELDIGQQIHETLALLERNHAMPIQARIRLPEHVPRVRANPLQLHKTLACLIQNAMEAMARADAHRPSLDIRIGHLEDRGMVEVTVGDNGPGLDPAMGEVIFDPFFSTKVDGLGMGLTISRAMIEAQGGRLWVDPECKVGARMCFTLPAVR